MRFSELVRLLERNGFGIARQKGSIRYSGKPGVDRLIRIDHLSISPLRARLGAQRDPAPGGP
jgi:hypothetical protein